MNTSLYFSLLVIVTVCNGYLYNAVPKKPNKAKQGVPQKGFKLFEGDIRVSVDFDPTKRNAVSDKGLLWPGAIVHYTISNSYNATYKRLFREAMTTIEDATAVNGKKCVSFVPRTNQHNYVHLVKLRDCSADLGRKGKGEQTVSLGTRCYTKGTVIHELLHTLGFYHEQSRVDRNEYVEIHDDNIRDWAKGNFKRYARGAGIDHLDQPYDYDSIMHYKENSFAIDSKKPTITAKNPLPNGIVLGQRDHLSQIDIKMIQILYGCESNKPQGTVSDGLCRDKLKNCYMYGEYACKELPDWANENCRLSCGNCERVCKDRIPDCAEYGDVVCKGDYVPWATENCAKFCTLGDCAVSAKTPAAVQCRDTITDCAEYGKDVCVTHKSWASDRCQRFCRFCEEAKPLENMTTVAATPKPCYDKMDCSRYSKSTCTKYASYMKSKCPQFCSLCPGDAIATGRTKARHTTPTTTTMPTTTGRGRERGRAMGKGRGRGNGKGSGRRREKGKQRGRGRGRTLANLRKQLKSH